MTLPTRAGEGELQAKTAPHYDSHPFEFLSPVDETSIDDMQPVPFGRRAAERIRRGDRIADIGCRPRAWPCFWLDS